MKPKALRRDRFGVLWRDGHAALKKLQQTLAKHQASMPEDQLAGSGIPQLMIRLNDTLRENARAELDIRRASFELMDWELERLARVRSDAELLEAVRKMQQGDTGPAPEGQPTAGDPNGPPQESPQTSEGHPDGGPQEATTEAGEARTDDLRSTEEGTVH